MSDIATAGFVRTRGDEVRSHILADDDEDFRSRISRSTRFARCASMPCRRPTPAIPARRWRWRQSSTSLWNNVLRFDPDSTRSGRNRDRFVLSAGHASMLLYSLLHLTERQGRQPGLRDGSGEPAVTLDDIKKFRQLDSRCPGHPEYRWTSGVETHHRPAGHGRGHRASAWPSPAEWQAEHFNRPGFELFDYDVYALGGDGCMMEGISARPPRSPGTCELDNLCWIYDNNKITIEGHTALRVQRRRGHALHRLRLERHARRRRQRPRQMLDRAFDAFTPGDRVDRR